MANLFYLLNLLLRQSNCCSKRMYTWPNYILLNNNCYLIYYPAFVDIQAKAIFRQRRPFFWRMANFFFLLNLLLRQSNCSKRMYIWPNYILLTNNCYLIYYPVFVDIQAKPIFRRRRPFFSDEWPIFFFCWTYCYAKAIVVAYTCMYSRNIFC